MTETRTSRANTPRARATQRTSQASRRASSVPAVGSKKVDVLDCVLMTPRKRKRTSLHEDLPPQASQTRLGALACLAQKKPPTRTRARARSAEKDAPSSSRASSRTRKRASSPIPAAEKTPRRRASASTQAADTPTKPSPAQRRRATSRMSAPLGHSKPASTSRTSGAASTSRRNKGKGKALPVDFETSSQINADGSVEAESPTSGTRRRAKRRRLSLQQLSDEVEYSPTVTMAEVDIDSQETAVEEDTLMLDMPDDASLPWVPIDPHSKDSTYVPPGINALIEEMKHTLVLEMTARQKAEEMHAEELQRRRALEHEAARLAAANRALEAERSAWTASAAEALASTLESALVADMTRRLAAETQSGALEGVLDAWEPQRSADAQISAEAAIQTPGPVLGLDGLDSHGALATDAGVSTGGDNPVQTRDDRPEGVASTAAMQP